jgi:hypothetical protein
MYCLVNKGQTSVKSNYVKKKKRILTYIWGHGGNWTWSLGVLAKCTLPLHHALMNWPLYKHKNPRDEGNKFSTSKY